MPLKVILSVTNLLKKIRNPKMKFPIKDNIDFFIGNNKVFKILRNIFIFDKFQK